MISPSDPASGWSGDSRRKTRIGEAEDDAEEVVEVVSNPAGEDADRLHLLRLPELLLEAAPRGRVLHHVDAGEGATRFVVEQAYRRLDDDSLAGLGDVRHLAAPLPRRPQASGVRDVIAGSPFRAQELRAIAANRLGRGVAVEAFGRFVPVSDLRSDVGRDDRLIHLREDGRLEAEALLGFALRRHVVTVADDPAHRRLMQEVRGRPFEPAPGAVLVPDARGDLDGRPRWRTVRRERGGRVVGVKELERQLAEDLCRTIAEDALEVRAHVPKVLALVDDDHGVGAVLDERAEAVLARLDARGVARRNRADLADGREDRRVTEEGHASRHDLDLEDFAVLSPVVPALGGRVDPPAAREKFGDVRRERRSVLGQSQLAGVHREELLPAIAVGCAHRVVDGEDREADLIEHPGGARSQLEEGPVRVLHRAKL